MNGRSILLILLVTAQEVPKKDADPDKARRATIVDRIMAEPAPPVLRRPAPPQAPEEPRALRVDRMRNRRQINLERKEIEPAEDEGEDRLPMMFRPINLNEMAVAADSFDSWVFGEVVDEEKRSEHLFALLSGKIHALEQMRAFDRAQSGKLWLAGRGDIKRFFDRVEERRADFEAVRMDFNAGRAALVQLEPLATEYEAGPFGDDSFFAKTLRKIENDATTPHQGGK